MPKKQIAKMGTAAKMGTKEELKEPYDCSVK